MSAVIWLGIVAVWAFVLIPTWVRRSDINWRRFGEPAAARDTLGRAARVLSRGTSSSAGRSPRTRTVPATGGAVRVTTSTSATSRAGREAGGAVLTQTRNTQTR